MTRCAKCPGELKPEVHRKVEIDRCGKCDGIFLDKDELKKVITDGDPRTVLESETAPVPGGDAFRAVCPRCTAPMDHHPRADLGIAFDICPTCLGIWLDHGELSSLDAREDKRENLFDVAVLRLRRMFVEAQDRRRDSEVRSRRHLDAMRGVVKSLLASGVLSQEEARARLKHIDLVEAEKHPDERTRKLLEDLESIHQAGFLSDVELQKKKREIFEGKAHL